MKLFERCSKRELTIVSKLEQSLEAKCKKVHETITECTHFGFM